MQTVDNARHHRKQNPVPHGSERTSEEQCANFDMWRLQKEYLMSF